MVDKAYSRSKIQVYRSKKFQAVRAWFQQVLNPETQHHQMIKINLDNCIYHLLLIFLANSTVVVFNNNKRKFLSLY